MKIELDGLIFPTTENAFQASKSLDQEVRKYFLRLSPDEAKKLGRQIQCRPDWEDVKDDVMCQILKKKYKHPLIRKWLLATGDAYLEETNTWGDTYWGVCKGVGKNKLGRLIMRIRQEIRDELEVN